MELVEAGNDAIMRRTGLLACDLRNLDSLLSYPSILLGRERAIVINLEHVKAVITVQTVLLLNSRDPSVTLFVHELQAWILRHHQDSSSSKHHAHPDAVNILPFEFVALEGCLRTACSKLVKDAERIKLEAHSLFHMVTFFILTLNFKRFGQIKIRLVDIIERVKEVRDVLDELLWKRNHMTDICLTEKLAKEQLYSHGTRGSTYSAVTKQLDVEKLHKLLETYCLQMDGTLKKLSTLKEYICKKEADIGNTLHYQINNFIKLGLILCAASLLLGLWVSS